MTLTIWGVLAEFAAEESQNRKPERQLGNLESIVGEIAALANSDT